MIKVNPKDPPWIHKNLKTMLNRQQRLYRNYKRHGFKPEDKIRVDSFREECLAEILKYKTKYLENLGNKLADPNTCQKTYKKVINRVMNKCKSPKIPPILINNIFVLNAKEKANEFIKYFSAQCTPLVNDSTLPNLSYHTEQRLNHLEFTREDILSLIRNLNKNKSCGYDGISARMLSICDISLVVPLKLIFNNILATGVFPEI